jgi:dTDP-glucose pyrophosphorylase
MTRRLADALVPEGATLRDVLAAMTRSARQVALIVDRDGRLLGLMTDGDARKALLRGLTLESAVDTVMNRTPVVASAGVTRNEALAVMRRHSIRHVPVLDERGVVVELLRLEDLLAPVPPLDNIVVIMAGGEGKRLRPITESIPKPLVTVGGQPIVEILIERLRQAGLCEMLLAVHHKAHLIRDRLGDGTRLGVRLHYIEETVPLGTMGALRLTRERLNRTFFVVNADILTKCDFRAMLEFHSAQPDTALTVGVSLHQVEIPYGEFTLRGTRVERLEEKPRKEFPVNTGIYVMEPEVIDVIPADRPVDATDVIRALLARDRVVSAYHIREYWLDVGRHPDLQKADHDVIGGLLG